MSDAEKVHRWMTQAELDAMLERAYRRGAEAMREAAAIVVTSKESVWSTVAELAQSIRTLPVSEAPCKICGRHDQPHDPCDCADEDKR